MASYVNSTLVNGEKIICQAHYHWFFWAVRILSWAAIMGSAYVLDLAAGGNQIVLTIAGFICLVDFVYAYCVYTYDEMVITNHRVVLKTGIFSRDVFEMQIQKVETVVVDQSIPGRIFNFGKIACRGTGGTLSKSITIESPLEFRAAFQNAVKEASNAGIRSDIASVVSDVTSYDSAKLDEIISLLKEISDKLDR